VQPNQQINEGPAEIPTNLLLSRREYENENGFTIEIQKKSDNFKIFYGETNLNDYVTLKTHFY
jgi:hypothetical protein